MQQTNKKMKKAAMSRLWIGLLILVIGIGITAVMVKSGPIGYMFADENVFNMNTYDLETTAQSDREVQKFYTFNGNMLLDWYGTSEETNGGRYYILPTYDQKFMGLYASGAAMQTAEQIVSEYQAYLTGGEGAAEPTTFLQGKGYVYYMGSTEKGFFQDYMKEFLAAIGVEDAESYLVYKTMYLCDMSDAVAASDWLVTIVGFLMIVIGIGYMVPLVTGGYKKQPARFIKEYGILPGDLESDMTSAIHKKNIDIGKKYAMVYGTSSYLIPYSQLLWTYVLITTTTHRTYGIKTGTTKSYQVFFVMRNHKKYTHVVKTEDMGHEIVQDITARAPHVIGGYHKELDEMFNKNFNELVRIVDTQKAKLVSDTAERPEDIFAEQMEDTRTQSGLNADTFQS